MRLDRDVYCMVKEESGKREIKELPWIRYDQNPYGVPLLDLRPITYQLGSDIEESALKNLDSYSLEDGASFSGSSPVTEREIVADLRYRIDGKLYPGSLFVPQTPDDRWAIFFDGQALYFVRSWSRELVAKASVRFEENQMVIDAIEGRMTDSDFETENQTVALLNFLMLSHVLGESAPVPLLNELEHDTNRAAVWAFSLFGHRAKVGVFAEDALFSSKKVVRTTTAYHIAIANDDQESVKLILQQGLVDPNLLAQDGFTPIHWALYTDHYEMMKLLAEQGVDLNLLSLNGTTPLMDAVEIKSEKGLAALLTLGADPNKVDLNGFSALHRAAAMGLPKMVKALLLAGAAIDCLSHNDLTPVDLAKESGNQEVIALLTPQD
ncbi:hypothetical protein DC080_08755 [Ignatzschineria cameli]|nr:hypothetical protein DC080_08755 [Ignatzschineria cameli]